MTKLSSKTSRHIFLVLIASFYLTGCIGTVVGAVVDTTIEIVKIPFKVGGAVIDVVTPDNSSDDFQENGDGAKGSRRAKSESHAAALKAESEGI